MREITDKERDGIIRRAQKLDFHPAKPDRPHHSGDFVPGTRWIRKCVGGLALIGSLSVCGTALYGIAKWYEENKDSEEVRRAAGWSKLCDIGEVEPCMVTVETSLQAKDIDGNLAKIKFALGSDTKVMPVDRGQNNTGLFVEVEQIGVNGLTSHDYFRQLNEASSGGGSTATKARKQCFAAVDALIAGIRDDATYFSEGPFTAESIGFLKTNADGEITEVIVAHSTYFKPFTDIPYPDNALELVLVAPDAQGVDKELTCIAP